jgi:hypothetical protein
LAAELPWAFAYANGSATAAAASRMNARFMTPPSCDVDALLYVARARPVQDVARRTTAPVSRRKPGSIACGSGYSR